MTNLHIQREEPSYRTSLFRKVLAFFIFIVGTGYAASTVLGLVKETQKIDPVTLAIIILAVVLAILLWSPETFARLKLFQGFELKLELGEVKQRQEQQESQLRDIDLILPILFPKTERDYLLSLSPGAGKIYKASHSFRTDLHRLRSVELIRMLPGKQIGQMKDGTEYYLNDYVQLTSLGEHWVAKLLEIERAKRDYEGQDRGSSRDTFSKGMKPTSGDSVV